MLVYIILFIITVFIAFIYDKQKGKKYFYKIAFFLIFINIGFVQAFRYNTGTDYKGTYTNIYNCLLFAKSNYINLDFGYYLIYKLIIRLKFGLQMFFVLTGFLNTYLFVKAIFDNSKNVTIGLIIYYLGTAFFFSMNAIRQATSIGFFLISIKYLHERNFKKYITLNLIGFLFHSSSIIYLPIYFISNKKVNFKRIIIFLIFVFLMSNLLGNMFNNILQKTKYYRYYTIDSSEFKTGRLNLQAIVNLMLLFIWYLYYKKFNQNNEYIMYCNIIITCAIVSFVGMYVPAGFRMISSLKYIDILAIPNLVILLKNSNSKKNHYKISQLIVIFLIFFIYSAYFGYSAVYKNFNDCIPYNSIF